ncbi:hypothetical protein ACFO0N_16210 [Halobium salinum]|uniref:Nudix hydrolase domain-containing protein n=1 Tax=Halobium salinum TaxID=1364940 RepID=A0ABD5PFF4_9EURY|nr:hypothetical protein [Halobium salinum]
MAQFWVLMVPIISVIQAVLRRFANSTKQVFAIREEPTFRVWMLLAVLLTAVYGLIWWFVPSILTPLSINLLAGVIGGVVGVYFSLDVIRPYVRTVERRRIESTPRILESYENIYDNNRSVHPDFIRLDEIAAWKGRSTHPLTETIIATLPDPIGRVFRPGIRPEVPLAVEYVPEKLRSVSGYSCTQVVDSDQPEADNGGLYEVPTRLQSLLEPYEEDIREMFLQEGRKNEEKMRLDGFDDKGFVYSKTTYYRSFLTNFCPDYPPQSPAPIRKLTAPLLFDTDGETIPLSESPFSNHFGGGGLVVTTDGKILLSVRGKTVAVEGNSKHLSFSGSFDYETVRTEGLRTEIEDIVEDETGIGADNIIEICVLGVTRRIERLGKPDLVTIVLVDEDVDWGPATDQFISIDAVPIISEGAHFESIDDVFTGDRPLNMSQKLIEHLNERAYPPSLGLVSAIYLINAVAKKLSSDTTNPE